jgi:hypothetical protein
MTFSAKSLPRLSVKDSTKIGAVMLKLPLVGPQWRLAYSMT